MNSCTNVGVPTLGWEEWERFKDDHSMGIFINKQQCKSNSELCTFGTYSSTRSDTQSGTQIFRSQYF